MLKHISTSQLDVFTWLPSTLPKFRSQLVLSHTLPATLLIMVSISHHIFFFFNLRQAACLLYIQTLHVLQIQRVSVRSTTRDT